MMKRLQLAVFAPASLLALTACVTDLPGAVYHVRLPEPPQITECVALSQAIAAAVGVSSPQPYYQTFRPWSSRKICNIAMSGNNSPRPCAIFVYVSSTDATIGVSITESNGRGFTNLSPSSEEISHRIRALLSERYPNAEIKDLRPVQGPFAP